MPLNLDEYKFEDETVTLNDKDFILTANVPAPLIGEMQRISTMNVNENDDAIVKQINSVILSILCLKNDPAESKKFMEELNFMQFSKLSAFMAKYIRESVKKKTESETLSS